MINIREYAPAIYTLAKVLNENVNEDVLSDIVWAFSYITDEGGDENILPFIKGNVAPRLLQLLNHTNNLIAVPSLRTLGNILTASDELTAQVLDQGVLEAFTTLLDHPKRVIKKEICWTISNITAGQQEQI